MPKPTADFIANPTSGDVPLTVQFTDNSTENPTSWQWDFGDGGSSTEPNPSHTYTSSGKYTVSLTATNDCGSDTETKTDYIEVIGPDISVDPPSLGFRKVVVEDSEDEILTISNEGNADLEVTNITADKPDFSVSETSFTIPPDDSHEITVTFTPQAEGEITGNLTIESNDPDEGTLPVPVAGVGVPYVNRTLSLDGVSGNYVEISDDSSLNFGASTDFSIVMWVKGNTISTHKGMVLKGQVYHLGHPGYQLCFRGDGFPQYIRFELRDNNDNDRMLDTYFDIDDGNWHWVAITCDRDGYAKSYIDGAYQTQRDISGIGNIDNTNTFDIGSYFPDGGGVWDGLIDEVRIWEVALTQAQIQSTMHLRLTGNEPGLVGYWRLDEEPGTPTAHDSSPFGNDGTLFGDADFVEPGAPIARPTVEPNILVYPIELDFGDVIIGKFDEKTLTVVNTGEQDLHVWDISSDNGDVTVTPNSFSLAMGQSQQVFVRYSPQTEGPLYATLQIESDDPDEGIVEVVVIGQGVPYVNRALSLDGDGDCVEIPHSPELDLTGDLTIEIWMRASSPSNGILIAKRDSNVITPYSTEIHKSGMIRLNYYNGSVWYTGDTSTGVFQFDGNWHHLAFIRNVTDNKTYIYYDTAEVLNETAKGAAVANPNEPVRIGYSFEMPWAGQIDEVRIWNTTRTQEQIRADMNQPIENPELLPNLVGYWNFDDGTADDLSLYGNHGTLMGDAEIVPLYGTWPRPLRGDVSGDGTISAYDAALILQYVVGLRDSFPAEMLTSPDGISPRDYILSLPELTANAGNRVQTPIFINDATGLMAGGITLKYNPAILKAVNVTSQTLFLNGAYNKANVDRQGEVRFAFATTQPMKGRGNLFTVEFEVLPNTTGETSPLILDNVELSNSLSITKMDGSVTVLPSQSALLQNFPNPFNPETWIPYQLAKEAEVVIQIYNIKGQLIRAIALGNKNAGVYSTKDNAAYWDGKDGFGEKVASGVYLYSIQAGSFIATRKMVIAK